MSLRLHTRKNFNTLPFILPDRDTPALYSVSLCLTRAQRLRTPDDYRRVYQSKQWGSSSLHSYNVLAIDSKGIRQASLLGVTVSKKVSRLAVRRNRIKRQIKDFYRLRQQQLPDAELVITAKPGCAVASDHERQLSLEELWKKLLKWQRWHLLHNIKV